MTAAVVFSGCTKSAELGTTENPIKISLVPGQDMKVLEENGERIVKYLEKDIGLKFALNVPVSFVAVVEALGTKRADIGLMNTFGYLLAHDKYGARVRLIGLYNGNDQYWGEIIARTDGPKTVEEINGKRFAFVDPASTSGYVLAAKLFQEKNIKPKEVIFAGRHDSVVLMVYQKRIDAGACYYALPDKGEPQDARKLVKTQFPDVMEKVKILAKTGPIPNDPVVFRKDFPIDIQEKIVASLKKYIATQEGAVTLEGLYHMNGLRDASDDDYIKIRAMLKDIGKAPQDFVK